LDFFAESRFFSRLLGPSIIIHQEPKLGDPVSDKTRFLPTYVRMESLLKKRARAHKYKNNLSNTEINTIIARHVPRLKSIQVFNLGDKTKWPEVTDEYREHEERIVQDVRADLQKEFKKKVRLPKDSPSEMGLAHYLNSI